MWDSEEDVQPSRVEAREHRADHADVADDDFTVAPLDPPHAAAAGFLPRFLPRLFRGRRAPVARALGLAATALLVVVVAASVFAHSTSDPRGAMVRLLGVSTPVPTATLVYGQSMVYFSNGAPWGALTLDGKRLPQTDLMGYAAIVTPGVHHLMYQARYFPTLRCVFSAPRASSDTCPLDTSATTLQFMAEQGLARAIDLGSTGATLQADQRAALTQLANDILGHEPHTTTIEPGDRYLDEQGRLVTATAPLRFQIALSLDSTGVTMDNGSGPCSQFCPSPMFNSGAAPSDGGWLTQVMVVATWSISDASGHTLTTPNYQATRQYPSVTQKEVGIQPTPQGWRITGLETMTTEIVQDAAMNGAFAAEGGGIAGGMGISFNVGANPLDGVVVDAMLDGSTARLLWRFGALLALDAAAHRDFPALPVANATEQAVEARILATQTPLRDDSILPTG